MDQSSDLRGGGSDLRYGIQTECAECLAMDMDMGVQIYHTRIYIYIGKYPTTPHTQLDIHISIKHIHIYAHTQICTNAWTTTMKITLTSGHSVSQIEQEEEQDSEQALQWNSHRIPERGKNPTKQWTRFLQMGDIRRTGWDGVMDRLSDLRLPGGGK